MKSRFVSRYCAQYFRTSVLGIVRVVMKGDARIDYQFDPIKVTGTFKVKATHEDGYCVDIFQLEADSVSVLK